MVWLDIADENGCGFYLDIRGIETRFAGGDVVFAISGVLGDGRAEAEVLVEVGRGIEVILVDEWLGKGRLRELFDRVSREELMSALVEKVSGISFCIEPAQQVRGYRSSGHWQHVRTPSYAGQMDLPLAV